MEPTKRSLQIEYAGAFFEIFSSSGGSGQATRPLQLNVGHCHDVKSAQKEAVLSCVSFSFIPL